MKKICLMLLFMLTHFNSFAYSNLLSKCENGAFYIYYKNLNTGSNNWYLVKNLKCNDFTQVIEKCNEQGTMDLYNGDDKYTLDNIKCSEFKVSYPQSNIY